MYPYRRFLLLDIGGEATGTVIFLVLGYTFGASWEAIGDVLSTTSLFILVLLIALYLVYRLIRMMQRMRDASTVQERQGGNSQVSVPIIRERPDSLPL